MNGTRLTWLAGITLTVLATGCSTKDKQRIAMLENANRNLTARLNQTQAQLDQTARDRQNLEARLAAAQGRISGLETELASIPEPQPAAAPGWTATPAGAMIAIESGILFQPGRATLRPEAQRTLDRIVSNIRGDYADKDILIFGHTDDRPIQKSGWDDNYQLSTERALAVTRYLIDRGVPPARVVACGWGEHHPREPNASEASRLKNRRVEIYAIAPEILRTPS